MPERTSKEKQEKIIQLYLEGVEVKRIPKKSGVSRSQASVEIHNFKTMSEHSLEVAGRKYGVSAIIAELRGLGVDLHRLKLTPAECKEAVRYIAKLNELGVQLGTLKPFVNLLTRLDKEKIPMKEYLEHGLKMSELEKEVGMNYKDLLMNARKAKESVRTAKKELKDVIRLKARENKNLVVLVAEKEKRLKDAKLTEAKVKIAIEIHRLAEDRHITTRDLLAFLGEIKRLNLKLPTLLRILKEFLVE